VRRSAGDSLHAQPAPCEKCVRRTGSVVVTGRSYDRLPVSLADLGSPRAVHERSISLPTPDEWQHEVDEALFGTDEAEASPDQLGPASVDFPPTPEAGSWRRDDDAGEDLFDGEDPGAVVAPVGEQVAWQPASSSGAQPLPAVAVDDVDTALFGSAAASAPTAPPPPEPVAPPLADPDEATVVDPDEETIIAELADEADVAEPTGPRRRRRRVLVLAEYAALVVIIGAAAGALIAGRSGSTRPGSKTVSDRTTATTATTAPAVTTTTVPATTAPAVTAPPPAPTARTPATSRRTVPPPAEPSVEPEPPPPAPPPTDPPPSTSPPSTSPLP
jgi:hypothetical protein